MIKKLLLVGLCVAWSAVAQATTYYVSRQGRDRHTGTSPDQAWRTLEKVNAMMESFLPGDNIRFRRGDRFAGQLLVTASGTAGRPITFGAYGEGDRPIIDGFQRLTQWTAVGNHLWKATYHSPHQRAYNLVINHRFQAIGRYPNLDEAQGGYLPISGGDHRQRFVSKALQGGPWTGGDLVVRTCRWLLDRAPITHHQGQQVSLASPTHRHVTNGFGFFVVNHRRALDQEGEWAYHHAERAVYLRTRRNPNGQAILTAHVPELVRIHRVQHITVRQLDLWGAAHDAVWINYSNHITVSDCRFYGSGQNGITVRYSQRTALLGNRFEQTSNNGITVQRGKFTEIANNTLTGTGMVAGQGASGNHAYCAIRGRTEHLNVHHNRIDQVGHNAISFLGDYINVQYNHVTNFCRLKDDGGGIYAGNSAAYPHRLIQIKNNIIGNDSPSSVGWGTAKPDLAHVSGVYLDNRTNNATLENNTVYGCQIYGLYLHNAYNNRLQNNTVYDSWRAIGMVHDDRALDTPLRDNIVQHNVLFARTPDQELLHFRSLRDDILKFGTFNQNFYHSPLKHERMVRVTTDWNHRSKLYSVKHWQKISPYDQLSYVGTDRWPTHVVNRYLSGNLLPNGSFTDDVGSWQGWSKDGQGLVRHAKQALDGGSLTMAFATKGDGSPLSVSTDGGIGAFRRGEQFVLRYSLKSTGEGATMSTQLINKDGPYRVLSNTHNAVAYTERQEIEAFFTVEQAASQASVAITLPKNAHRVHVDNVSLRKVMTQPANHDRYVRFLTNPSRRRVSLALPSGRWKSARGRAFRGSVKLDPFQSMILLRDENGRAARQAHAEGDSFSRPKQAELRLEEPPVMPSERSLRLYPNPLVNTPLTVDIDPTVTPTEVQVYDAEGTLLIRRPVSEPGPVTFSPDELGTGLRLVRVTTSAGTWTGKVVVQ